MPQSPDSLHQTRKIFLKESSTMNILAFDSSTLTATAAITTDGSLRALYTLHGKNTHSETLLPMGAEVLNRAGMTLSQMDLLAVTAGPGSFTGIRIGVATVKGLAFGKNIPCVGVSAIEALAENLSDGMDTGDICIPVIDARRKQFYNALFEKQADGTLSRLCPDRLTVTDALVAELAAYTDRRLHITGDGYTAFRAALCEAHPTLSVAHTASLLRYPSGYAVAKCAERIYLAAEDKSVFTDSALSPIYLRATQAERERIGRETGVDPESL